VPHFEKVRANYNNGVKHERKTGGTREYKRPYQKATKKEKAAVPDEFTLLTGYRRKSAVRLLRHKAIKKLMIYSDGEAVKLSPGKKRPANRQSGRLA
jgi:hypothetical protein